VIDSGQGFNLWPDTRAALWRALEAALLGHCEIEQKIDAGCCGQIK
jgi:hypothetical protein